MCQYFVPFYGQNNVPLRGGATVYLLIRRWTSGLFLLFAQLSVTLLWTPVDGFLRGHVFPPLPGMQPRSRITRSRDNAMFNLLSSCQGVFRSSSAVPRSLRPCGRARFSSFVLLLRLLDSRHPSGREVVSSWHLICIPLMANECAHLVGCLLPIYVSSLQNRLFRSESSFQISLCRSLA